MKPIGIEHRKGISVGEIEEQTELIQRLIDLLDRAKIYREENYLLTEMADSKNPEEMNINQGKKRAGHQNS